MPISKLKKHGAKPYREEKWQDDKSDAAIYRQTNVKFRSIHNFRKLKTNLLHPTQMHYQRLG